MELPKNRFSWLKQVSNMWSILGFNLVVKVHWSPFIKTAVTGGHDVWGPDYWQPVDTELDFDIKDWEIICSVQHRKFTRYQIYNEYDICSDYKTIYGKPIHCETLPHGSMVILWLLHYILIVDINILYKCSFQTAHRQCKLKVNMKYL